MSRKKTPEQESPPPVEPETGNYTVVARRYRPQQFEDLVGQDPVAQALGNALKAAQTIDSAPERTTSRRLSAEEPVTSRIRRRHEAAPASQAAEPEAISPATETQPAEVAKVENGSLPPPAKIHPFPEPPVAEPARPSPAYRQRVSQDRRQQGKQLSLF